MRSFKRKKKGDIKEGMVHVKMTPAGCDLVKGTYNKKTGECEIRQIADPDIPDEVVHKEFDSVKRPEERSTTKTDEPSE